MGPGIPGVGVASLFYVAAALIAPFRELLLALRGRSSLHRWKLVGTQFSMGVAVVLAVVLFYWSVEWVITHGWMEDRRNVLPGPIPPWMYAFIALAALLIVVDMYAWSARRRSRDFHSDVIARAHRLSVTDQMGIVAGLTSELATPPRGRHLNYSHRVTTRSVRSIRDVDLDWRGDRLPHRGRHLERREPQ